MLVLFEKKNIRISNLKQDECLKKSEDHDSSFGTKNGYTSYKRLGLGFGNVLLQAISKNLPSRELTYHTWGKEKSSPKVPWYGIC